MFNTKQTQNGVKSPLPIVSPIQSDMIDADKVPIKRLDPEETE